MGLQAIAMLSEVWQIGGICKSAKLGGVGGRVYQTGNIHWVDQKPYKPTEKNMWNFQVQTFSFIVCKWGGKEEGRWKKLSIGW